METYSFLRGLADSWGLLAMAAFFIAICLWTLRPGSRAGHRDAATSIFRNDNGPAEASPQTRKEA